MSHKVQISVLPEKKNNEFDIRLLLASALSVSSKIIESFELVRENIDARRKLVKYILTYNVVLSTDEKQDEKDLFEYKLIKQNISDKPEIHIIGAGPAGLFAAIKAIENNYKPIILERGKSVKQRRRDLALLIKEHTVNPNSNYCFGEGGAGTFSDGKLYTRSKKRGSQQEILEKLVQFGATKDILIQAHPHIGTNKLPKIIENIRQYIEYCGGEIKFNQLLQNINITDSKIESIEVKDLVNEEVKILNINHLILATGHSARDIFKLLDKNKIALEFKPFSLGVRVEHQQSVIDSIQYHCTVDEVPKTREFLPAASYSWVKRVDERGVYSFCMCPGGVVAPCATEQDEIVTNGWSPSKRDYPFSNSGVVVEVEWDDLKEFHKFGPLAGMHFQKQVENRMWQSVGQTQAAPAQRLKDFVNGINSNSLPESSYMAGLTPSPVHLLLPNFISSRLRKAFKLVAKSMTGYLTNDAIVVATESRTSSPIRIPRNKDTFQHTQIKNLYPIGEGAGYAGGIISAAIDGNNCLSKIGSEHSSILM